MEERLDTNGRRWARMKWVLWFLIFTAVTLTVGSASVRRRRPDGNSLRRCPTESRVIRRALPRGFNCPARPFRSEPRPSLPFRTSRTRTTERPASRLRIPKRAIV